MQRKIVAISLVFSAIFAILVIGIGRAQQVPSQPNSAFLPNASSGKRLDQAYILIMDTTPKVVPLSLPDPPDEPTALTFEPTNGQPGDVVTIHGRNFANVVLVLFGTTPATDYKVASEGVLTATVPDDAQSGTISVITLLTSGLPFIVGDAVEPTAAPTDTISAPPTIAPPTTIPRATETPVPPPTTIPPTTIPTVPAPTATPGTPPAAQAGIWISQQEIDALPATGAGWTELLAAADANPGSPSLSNQDSDNNTFVMAEALVCAKTRVKSYCDRVITALKAVTSQNLESGSRALALGRELAAYVISADIINLKALDPATDGLFRAKIKGLLSYKTTEAGSLIDCDGNRPNNWGGHCGASRIAVDLYLGDKVDLDKAALVLRGWLGDRSAYAGFKYGALDWQSDPTKPVGVNPVGALITGHSVDGGQPEELRRAGAVHFPPTFTDYGWEGLQGRVASAHMLSRAGYDAWHWSDRGILRAVQFLYDISWPAVGDDKWQIWLINKAYGTKFPTTGGGHGKNIGWSAWTHQP